MLLKAAAVTLGPTHVLAITVSSPVHPDWELSEAENLARELGVQHIVIESDELQNEAFAANAPDRCYVCKFTRFGELKRVARDHGFDYVLDGSNVDDLDDFRPGQRAAEEHGVRSPLREAGFTKADIRRFRRNSDYRPGTGPHRRAWHLAFRMESASRRKDWTRSAARKSISGTSSPVRFGFAIMGTWRGSRWTPGN